MVEKHQFATQQKRWRIISQKLTPPKICLLCSHTYKDKHAVCDLCLSLLPQLLYPCAKCALPLPNPYPPVCGECIKKAPITNELFIAHPFVEPLRTLIHLFKYHHGLYLSTALSTLMMKNIPKFPQTNVLIPVPIHHKRLQERGFNQAILLTKHLSQWLNIPYDLTVCEKKIYSLSQAHLSAHERQQNLLETFTVHPNTYEHVTLIDDVYTSGSTVQALAHGLKRQGVKYVDVWCIARTL
jgi:ComF family protein